MCSAMSLLTPHIDIWVITITVFFKNRTILGGIFPFILMETFSSLALLLLQRVYLKNACVVREPESISAFNFSLF